jgi:3-hydroxy-9,10-secoandrosta-1,3,5(10)-triene-9,17-dione monooxygenase reductase component
MPISPEDFRNTLRLFAAGVTILTVKSGERVHGLTVTGFVTISQSPPLVAVVIDHRGRAYDILEQHDAVFAVNILREGQEELSKRFSLVKEDRFALGKWRTAATGAPVLEDALAWLDCTVYSRYDTGYNTVYFGEVQAKCTMETGQKPLLYWNRNYHTFAE